MFARPAVFARVWRIEALVPPRWPQSCRRCDRRQPFESTGLFRVNAQGARHDVWLLYRCPACGLDRKRRLHRRVTVAALGAELQRYLDGDPLLAWRCAFEFPTTEPLACRVIRFEAAGARATQGERVESPDLRYEVQIQQPWSCGLRWDGLLAGELGLSRSAVGRAWRADEIRLAERGRVHRRLRSAVRDGQRLELAPRLAALLAPGEDLATLAHQHAAREHAQSPGVES